MKNCEKYRVGNFLFVKEKRGGMNHITCSTLTKEWHVRVSEGTMMYAVVKAMIDTDETDRLASLATLWYGHCVMLHSAEYYAAVSKALVDDVERAGVPDVSDDKDAEMLVETVRIEDVKDELEKGSRNE